MKLERRSRTYFHAEERDTCKEVDCGLEVLKLLGRTGRKVVPVQGQVQPQRVVQCIQ